MYVDGQNHAPAALSPGKEPRYPSDRWLSEPQNRNAPFGGTISCSRRDSNPGQSSP